MTPKEKVEELQKCADRHRDMHKARMHVEYQTLITSLTFYCIATWSVIQSISLNMPSRLVISCGFIILALFASTLLKRLHHANQKNIAMAENYEAEIIKHLEPNTNPVPEHLRRKNYDEVKSVPFFSSNWGFQSATVFGFALVGIILMWSK